MPNNFCLEALVYSVNGLQINLIGTVRIIFFANRRRWNRLYISHKKTVREGRVYVYCNECKQEYFAQLRDERCHSLLSIRENENTRSDHAVVNVNETSTVEKHPTVETNPMRVRSRRISRLVRIENQCFVRGSLGGSFSRLLGPDLEAEQNFVKRLHHVIYNDSHFYRIVYRNK